MPDGDDEYLDLHFPKAGIDLSQPFCKQPNRDVGDGVYARTTIDGVNVRGFAPVDAKLRGAMRPGLSKYIGQPVIGGWVIQMLAVLVAESFTPGTPPPPPPPLPPGPPPPLPPPPLPPFTPPFTGS